MFPYGLCHTAAICRIYVQNEFVLKTKLELEDVQITDKKRLDDRNILLCLGL